MTSAPSEPRSDRERPGAPRPPIVARSATGRSAPGRGRARMRVLVADDDERSLDCLVALLDREGFSTDPAHGGVEALARLGLMGEEPTPEAEVAAPVAKPEEPLLPYDFPLPYDFMVLDYNMPDLTGVEVMRRVRIRFGGPLPAIMVSGDYSHELLRSWSAVGGFSLLPKPVEPADFRTQVNLLIQRFFGGAQ